MGFCFSQPSGGESSHTCNRPVYRLTEEQKRKDKVHGITRRKGERNPKNYRLWVNPNLVDPNHPKYKKATELPPLSGKARKKKHGGGGGGGGGYNAGPGPQGGGYNPGGGAVPGYGSQGGGYNPGGGAGPGFGAPGGGFPAAPSVAGYGAPGPGVGQAGMSGGPPRSQ
jgi:hypothetical protein